MYIVWNEPSWRGTSHSSVFQFGLGAYHRHEFSRSRSPKSHPRHRTIRWHCSCSGYQLHCHIDRGSTCRRLSRSGTSGTSEIWVIRKLRILKSSSLQGPKMWRPSNSCTLQFDASRVRFDVQVFGRPYSSMGMILDDFHSQLMRLRGHVLFNWCGYGDANPTEKLAVSSEILLAIWLGSTCYNQMYPKVS